MLNSVVIYCENCMFWRAQVIIRGKTSHISWRHSTFLESLWQRRWSSAISWRQNNGKMAENDRSHVIAVLQRLNSNVIGFAPCFRVRARFYKLHKSWFKMYILRNRVLEAGRHFNCRLLSSSKLWMASPPAVRPPHSVRRQLLRATCVNTCVCFYNN